MNEYDRIFGHDRPPSGITGPYSMRTPSRPCRFSGCHEPYARTVERNGRWWELCDVHASRLEAP